MNPIGLGCVSAMSWKKLSVGMVWIKAVRRAHVVIPSPITVVAPSCSAMSFLLWVGFVLYLVVCARHVYLQWYMAEIQEGLIHEVHVCSSVSVCVLISSIASS